MFVISPLVYYLQADIRTGNSNTVKISIPDESFFIEFSKDIPFDAFKASIISFENRFKYQQNTHNHTMKVMVVLNEHDMREEFAHVYDIFSDDLIIVNYKVMVHNYVRKDDLKNIIENENTDFLHYIGHCDSDGLRCVDGNISMQSIKNSKVQTFFLNACGSINESLSLIEKGSVAGAVTLRPVLDKPAAKVGTTFAKLVINGFAFDKGLDIARKQILMHKFYTVVGDGTHRLTNGTDPFPIILHINTLENDTFCVSSVISSPQIAGASYQPKLKGKREFRLMGNETNDILSRDELIEFLEESNSPAIFEDELLWTDDVVEKIR